MKITSDTNDLQFLLDIPTQKNMSDRIFEQISTLIRKGELPEGYVFPNEAVLCQQLNIGRSTIREAYKALELAGYITRSKKGTVVNDSSAILEATPLKNLAEDSTREDFKEFRLMIELQTASSAADKATKKDVDILTDIQNRFLESNASSDFERITDIDVEFHKAIANATHNALIIASMTAVSSVWEKEIKNNFRRALNLDKNVINKTIKQHQTILDAIIARDASAARKAMLEHIEDMSI